MAPEQKPLLERMRLSGERYSPFGPKPQNLPFDDIVSRVADFMKRQEKLHIALIFGNEVGEELEDKNDERFDPIALFDTYSDQLDHIIMYVEHDLEFNEQELLSRKDSSLYAYNTLLFGAAIRLASRKAISRELRAFLVDHLIAPQTPKQPKKRGRPKTTNDDKYFRRL
uniref:hypothetical protein n=1 Tax=Roseovarius sp. TaxID=1486281 RepID=UPI00356761A8